MTQAEIKHVRSLSQQKYRKEHHAYLVEGDKNAKEWLASRADVLYIVAEASWLQENQELVKLHPGAKVYAEAAFIIEKISALHGANAVVLVVKQPEQKPFAEQGDWALMLEHIQDPGNMGTIIRTAAWFGIRDIVCSPNCVEVYNPKVIQATMGGLLQVNIHYMELEQLALNTGRPVYAACLDGAPLSNYQAPEPGYILMGNESKGLSAEMTSVATFKVAIPRIGKAESLNVSVATGIICASFLL